MLYFSCQTMCHIILQISSCQYSIPYVNMLFYQSFFPLYVQKRANGLNQTLIDVQAKNLIWHIHFVAIQFMWLIQLWGSLVYFATTNISVIDLIRCAIQTSSLENSKMKSANWPKHFIMTIHSSLTCKLCQNNLTLFCLLENMVHDYINWAKNWKSKGGGEDWSVFPLKWCQSTKVLIDLAKLFKMLMV